MRSDLDLQFELRCVVFRSSIASHPLSSFSEGVLAKLTSATETPGKRRFRGIFKDGEKQRGFREVDPTHNRAYSSTADDGG